MHVGHAVKTVRAVWFKAFADLVLHWPHADIASDDVISMSDNVRLRVCQTRVEFLGACLHPVAECTLYCVKVTGNDCWTASEEIRQRLLADVLIQAKAPVGGVPQMNQPKINRQARSTVDILECGPQRFAVSLANEIVYDVPACDFTSTFFA
jgi:hypothetical protein